MGGRVRELDAGRGGFVTAVDRSAAREYVLLHLAPPPVVQHKGACFVQPVRPASELAAGDERHLGDVLARDGVALHAETQPADLGLEHGGVGRKYRRVPSCLQKTSALCAALAC